MKRHSIVPRPNWQKTIFDQGLVFLSDPANPNPGDQDNQTPWQEDAAWEFTRDEIIAMESASEELFQMCLHAVDQLANQPILLGRMGLSEAAQQAVVDSWNQRHPTLYSRFDLALDRESGEYKMVEINGDTPTGAG